MRDSAARLTAHLDRMCSEYVEHLECDSQFCLRRRKTLDLQIKVLDGRLIFCARPELFYNIIIAFYRTRLMSREIGEKHGISSECVRTILSRMNACARELGYAAPQKIAASPEVRRMRKAQLEAYRAARVEERRIRAEQQEASRQYRISAAASKPRAAEIAAPTKSRPRHNDGLTTRLRWKRDGKCQRCGKQRDRKDRQNCGSCRKYSADYEKKKAPRLVRDKSERARVPKEVWRAHLSAALKAFWQSKKKPAS
jgi:hypothetical protein